MDFKITIGVAVYNIKESFLRECLDSITAQMTDSTELIIVDDCSSNGARNICMEYSKKHANARFIPMEKNSGISVVRNTIIDSARGEWVFFVDGDDMAGDYFVKNTAVLDSRYDIVLFDRVNFTERKQSETPSDSVSITSLPAGAAREMSIACLSSKPFDRKKYGMREYATPFSVCANGYRTEFLRENNIYFLQGQKKAQDVIFNISAFYYAKKTAYVPYAVNHYRKNPESICNRFSPDLPEIMGRYLQACFNLLKKLYDNDKDIKADILKYKVLIIIIENMQLDFFHRDNPNSLIKRAKQFKAFVDEEPQKTFFETFDIKSYPWRERRVLLTLAKRKSFLMLNLLYRHEIFMKIICGTAVRADKLKNILKPKK